MKVTVDKFGRVVLPKPLRDELGLDAGSVLVVEEVGGGILLKPVRDEPDLIDDDGILVFTGQPTGDVERAAEALRRGRLRTVGGFRPPRR